MLTLTQIKETLDVSVTISTSKTKSKAIHYTYFRLEEQATRIAKKNKNNISILGGKFGI